jgi:hypothetical protein
MDIFHEWVNLRKTNLFFSDSSRRQIIIANVFRANWRLLNLNRLFRLSYARRRIRHNLLKASIVSKNFKSLGILVKIRVESNFLFLQGLDIFRNWFWILVEDRRTKFKL